MKIKLHTQIFISIILGILTGLFLKENAVYLEFLGTLFIRLLRMVIIPLIFSSMVMGVISIGNIRSLGRLGGKTMAFFLSTTFISTFFGLALVNIFKPGIHSDLQMGLAKIPEAVTGNSLTIMDIFAQIIPTNIFQAFNDDQMLGVIFFSIFFGVVLTAVGERGQFITKVIDDINEVILKMTDWIMSIAPIGVFALIAALVGRTGLEGFKSLAIYMLIVILGLFLHTIFILFGSVAFIAKYNPLVFFKHMFPAVVTAFTTDSSIATLPVTMDCLEQRAGVSRKVTGFVSPLGATMNMNGTALFQTIAVIFIAQIYGIDLSIQQQLFIAVIATLASIGAAGIPSAGLITMSIIMRAVGVPLEGLGIILAVDRLLDMCRTTVNVFGDACCAAVIAKSEGEELYL